jgi:hypothetical protein
MRVTNPSTSGMECLLSSSAMNDAELYLAEIEVEESCIGGGRGKHRTER